MYQYVNGLHFVPTGILNTFQAGARHSQRLAVYRDSLQVVILFISHVCCSPQTCFTMCCKLWNLLTSENIVTLTNLSLFKSRVKKFDVYNDLCSIQELYDGV